MTPAITIHSLEGVGGKALCCLAGSLWAWVEPTLPYALLCVFAVFIDCVSAWMLNRRVKERYGSKSCDGKLKSIRMKRMISDLFMLFSCMLIAQGIDDFCMPADIHLYLGNIIAAIFLLITIVSILENISSCSNAKWAILVQRVVADKTKRHLNIDLENNDVYNKVSEGEWDESTVTGHKPYTPPCQSGPSDPYNKNDPLDPLV